MENIIVTDGIGGSYWIASADSGTVVVYPGYIEEPSNLQAVDGQDAYVALSWNPPSGPIPDNIVEDFEAGTPDDWTITTNSAQGWFHTSDCTSEWWTVPAHTNYMCSNDDQANDDGSVDYLVTPSLNVSGAASVILSFDSYFDGAYGHGASIGVSEDGVSFTEVYVLAAGTEWVTETVDLSPFITGDNLYILFHSNDNAAWASGWAVDDVSISFETRVIPERLVHYNLTELGEWVVSAPKEEVISSFGGGIPFADRVDLENPINQNNTRPVDIDAYKVYKSLNGVTDFEEIAEVEGSVNSYVDENVVNNTAYYYYVTAIYPDGSESVATNVVSATPVEWIECFISDGGSLVGLTDTIEISVNNEKGRKMPSYKELIQELSEIKNKGNGSNVNIQSENVARMKLQNQFQSGLDIARYTAAIMRKDMEEYDTNPASYTQSLGCWHGFIGQQKLISIKKHFGSTDKKYLLSLIHI